MHTMTRKVFRRSWLTVTRYWSIAVGIWLLFELAAHRPGLEDSGYALIWALPAILWATGWTLQWVFHTFTATETGHLVVRRGVIFRHRQIIHLCSVQDLESVLVSQRWGIGHITFKATDDTGQLQSFHWTWMDRWPHLYEILQARGRLPLVQQPQQRCSPGLGSRYPMQITKHGGSNDGGSTSLQDRSRVADYRRFLDTCHLVLRTEDEQWPPPQTSPWVLEVWTTVLMRAGVLLPTSNSRRWCMAKQIRTVRDVYRLMGEEEFQKAIVNQSSQCLTPERGPETR